MNTEDNKILDDPPSDNTSSREGSSSSSRRAGDSKEVNLVNFSDLFRRARTKSRSRVASAAFSDIRRRRRIKLKRDPSGGRGLGGSRDRGDASSEARNHIDTAQPPIKREHGSSFRSGISKESDQMFTSLMVCFIHILLRCKLVVNWKDLNLTLF